MRTDSYPARHAG